MKKDAQVVFAGFQVFFDFFFPTYKKVISQDHEFVVEVYIGVGIQTQAFEGYGVEFQKLLGYLKTAGILPIGFVHPLHLLFLHAKIRIADLIVPHQIGMHCTRYLGT